MASLTVFTGFIGSIVHILSDNHYTENNSELYALVSEVAQLMRDPLSLRSRLLAPTEMPVAPDGICQLCETTSQTEKSKRESVIVTVVDSPGARKMLSKPFKLNGAVFADAGGEV